MFAVGTVAEGKLVLIVLIIRIDDNMPSQVCFPKDEFIFCNWVHHPKKPGYAIMRNSGKWLRFHASNKMVEKLIEEIKKESPTVKVEDSKML